MPNIAIILREEIVRLTRREIKKETAGMKKASAQYRKDIAALKRTIARLQRINGVLERNVLAKPIKPPKDLDASKVRFSPRGLKTQRERLGLSAADYATLAGVSGLSVYNWEKGKARPRREQIATLAALRGLSKREAMTRLEQRAKRK
jgi:DNA-binding transcriptional regulator YiaG